MKVPPAAAPAWIHRFESTKKNLRPHADWLAREEPLEIRVRGRSVAVTMRTPGHDAELAAGFLLTEGLVRSRRDIVGLAHCRRGEAAQHRNTINVFLAPAVEVDFQQLTRHVFASSSCGLCGKSSIESVQRHFPPVKTAAAISAKELLRLPVKLRATQAAFAQTGGLHAAAVFSLDGKLVVAREDVGRHNAVDKVLGFALRRGRLPLDRHVLLVSGRASFEIMQKALAARVPIVAAVSAPSSLAVEFARASGQTLAGFLRDGSFNLYSHPERIQLPSTRARRRPRSRPRTVVKKNRGQRRVRGRGEGSR